MRTLLIALLLFPLASGAQERRPHPCLAFKGAKIYVDAETVIEVGTVVARDGLIVAVGGDVAVPPDAEVIDAKELYLYPGFIDALTPAGLGETQRTTEEIKKAEATAADFRRDALGAMEPANRKGVRPEFSAAERLQFSEEDLEKLHRGGFAALHVACADELFGGSTAFVSLNGGTRREILVRASTGQAMGLRTYGEGYPNTPMGCLAHLRQVLLDAARLRELRRCYDADPKGLRPPTDPSLEALWPVLEGRVPVYLTADTALEIERALDLADEFKFKPVICGAREAALAVPRLQKSGAPVIVSLKHLKEPKRPRKTKAPAEPNEDRPYEERPKTREQYEEERREWELRIRGAAALHEAGIPFAFSTAGLKEPGEALKSLSTLVARGLPPAAAMKALTAGAASILGVEKIFGTIAPGRPATLTALTAPLGDREARVRTIVAEGFKFEVKLEGKAAPPPEIDLTGAWAITAEKTDAGKVEAVLKLQQKGRELKGTATCALFGEGKVLLGSVAGKSFRFTLTAKLEGDPVEFAFKGELAEGALKGTASGPIGDDISWTGKKTP